MSATSFCLGVRDDHVVLAERDAGAAGMAEAERHDAVAEDHRLLLAAVAIDRVDHLGDVLLGHLLVGGLVTARSGSSAAARR